MIILDSILQEGEPTHTANQPSPSGAASTASAAATHQAGKTDNIVVTYKGNNTCGADQFYAISNSAGEACLSAGTIWGCPQVHCLSKSK